MRAAVPRGGTVEARDESITRIAVSELPSEIVCIADDANGPVRIVVAH